MAIATTAVAPRTPRRPHLPAPSHKLPRHRASARVSSSTGVSERRGFVQRLRESPGRAGLTDCQYGQPKSGTAGYSSVDDSNCFASTTEAAAAAREWLAERGHTPVADGILGAFQRASIGASQWPSMLAGMTSMELAALVGSVKRQNALAAAVHERRESPITAPSGELQSTGGDSVNSPATCSDTGDSDTGSSSSSSSSDDGSERDDDSSSSGDEVDSPADKCNKGHLRNAERTSKAELSSSMTKQSVPWLHAVGEQVDLDALYHKLSAAERSTSSRGGPAGQHCLESAWARHVARLFQLSWQLRQHQTCCGWITSTVHEHIRDAQRMTHSRQIFLDAMLATTDTSAPASQSQAAPSADRSIERGVAPGTLIARAQQRARNAAWGLNNDASQLCSCKIEAVSQGSVGSLWTEVASTLLLNSEQRDFEGTDMERHVVARRNAGLIALAETVQKVVVVNNGKRVETRR